MDMSKTMKGIVAALAGVLIVSCVGCGGGGGAPGQGGVPGQKITTTPAPAKTFSVDVEGDSLLWGQAGTSPGGAWIQSTSNPPALIQAGLQAEYGYGVTVQNNAIPGASLPQSLMGSSPYQEPFVTRLSTSAATYVMADYAINDSMVETVDAYRMNLEAWVDDVRGAGKIPVLEEPNPTCDSVHTNVLAYRNVMDEVAQAKGVALIAQYAYVLSLPNWQGMLRDCVHPTDALYQLKAQREIYVLSTLAGQN